jgi:uncharacterized membrane protein
MLTDMFPHLHQILVHFPIALVFIGTLYDLYVAWRNGRIAGRKGLLLWVVAAISAWFAVWSGPDNDARGNTNSLDTHSLLANLTALAVTALVLFRIFRHLQERDFTRGALSLYLLVSILISVLVLTTGYYGGKMVYDDGVGVSVSGKAVNPPKPMQQHK